MPPQSRTPEAVAQHIRLGAEAMSRQAWPEATIHYEAILSADPNNPLAHQMLGRIGDQTQKFESAEYHYLRALTSRPQDPNLLSDLGYSYLQQGRLRESKQYLLKALAIDTGHRMAKVNLAAVEAYSGNNEAALALLRQISSEQEANQTLHELLSRPAPYELRDQQLMSQGGDDLPLAEQMRIARETAQRQRERREQLEELATQQRVRQAMALGGPLSQTRRGIADEQLNEMIQQIEDENRRPHSELRSPNQQQQYGAANMQPPGSQSYETPSYGVPSQFGTAQQFGATQQFGTPPQQAYGPPATNGYGPTANQYPPPGSGPDTYAFNGWSNQNGQAPQGGATPGWNQQPPQYDSRGYGPPNGQQPDARQWQTPAQNSQQWGTPPQNFNASQNGQPTASQQEMTWQGPPPAQSLPPWNGPPPLHALQNGAPTYSQQQSPSWQGQTAQNSPDAGMPPVLNNLQEQNEQLFQQQAQQQIQRQQQTLQYGSQPAMSSQPQNFPGSGAATNTNPWQSFPNGQPQYATPNQYAPANRYTPPPGDGVWNPQESGSPYGGTPGGEIQQLGYQASEGAAGGRSNTSAAQHSMRQALRLGMAAGPGSLIQMSGQPSSSVPSMQQTNPNLARPARPAGQHAGSSDASNAQQFFPENVEPQPGGQSPAAGNAGNEAWRQIQSPNQNNWQSGPMGNSGPAASASGNNGDSQWQNLPPAQRQPQSSTWDFNEQQPVGPMQSQNRSQPQSPGSTWQANSFASPTMNDNFAPRFMLHPDPTQTDNATTLRADFDSQGRPSNMTTTAQGSPTGNQIPWTVQ